MSQNYRSLLEDVQWDDGFPMPVGNHEIKALEKEIKEKEQKTAEGAEELALLEDALKYMYNHEENVRQQHQLTVDLLSSWKKDLDTERLMHSMAQREQGRLRQEISRLEVVLGDVTVRISIAEKYIYSRTKKLEVIREHLDWSAQEMDEWTEACYRHMEDNMALQKYTRDDNDRIRGLIAQLEKCQMGVLDKQKRCKEEDMKMKMTQLELDKTANSFRTLHQERQEILELWERILEQMEKREQQTEELAQQLREAKEKFNFTSGVLLGEKAFMEHQEQENKDLELKIDDMCKMAGRKQQALQEAEKKRLELVDEMDIVHRRICGLHLSLQATKSEIHQLAMECAKSEDRLLSVRQWRIQLEIQLGEVTEANLTAEQIVTRVEGRLAQEEETHVKLMKQIKGLGRELEVGRLQLTEAKGKEKAMTVDLQGAQGILRSLVSYSDRLSVQNDFQRDQLAAVESREGQLLGKIHRMEGQVDKDAGAKLERQIHRLEKRLQRKCDTKDRVNDILKRTNFLLLMLQKEMHLNGPKWAHWEHELYLMEWTIDANELKRKKLVEEKKSHLADMNIVKLDLKKLEEAVRNTSKNVLTLEQRRANLQQAMRERQVVIQHNKEGQLALLRSAEEEKSKYISLYNDANTRIEQAKRRFEVLTSTMSTSEDGKLESVSAFAEKFARELEELRCEGKVWNAKVTKAQEETKALRNTYALINERHDLLRKSYIPVPGDKSD